MRKDSNESSTGRIGRLLTWLSSVLICLFLFSCAQGGGIADLIEAGTGGGGTAGTSGDQGLSGYCGDGIISGLEVCDGISLNGATCGTLGEGSGTLACGSDCNYDISMCSGNGGAGYGG